MEQNEILVIHGQNPVQMAQRLCEKANLAGLIGAQNARIGLKPNLVLARRAEEGATTHPQVVEGVILYLQAQGFANITILEGSWVGDRTKKAFEVCGYNELAKKYNIHLVDTQRDKHKIYEGKTLSISVCDAAMDLDFMINMPVMKGHCQTALTCALKNNKGIIPDAEKRRFHSLGLHRPIAELNTICRNDFILVDSICGDLDFEEGGNPVVSNRLFAARDPVLCDAFAASQMGYAAREISYIGLAEALGVGSASLDNARVRALNSGEEAGPAPKHSGKARRLTAYIKEDSACSACYAAVVRALSRLDHRQLDALPRAVCVGQGFKGKQGALGVGQCCAAFSQTVPGCPPSAETILSMLRSAK